MLSALDEEDGVCVRPFSPVVDQRSTDPEAYWGAIDIALVATQMPGPPEPAEPELWLTTPMMHGPAVKTCQTLLVRHCYEAELTRSGELDEGEDGWFGEDTNAAVRKFQGDKSLEVDGIVGPITWAALEA
jgi:peptidoglycan hydrolase-like protein with peptidoglycan-binding domain